MRLVSELTNGSIVEINDTGTSVNFIPGAILGGPVAFDCGLSRPIGYFLEMVIPLAPFSKRPFELALTGLTHGPNGPSIDSLRLATLGLLRTWNLKDGLDIKVSFYGVPALHLFV